MTIYTGIEAPDREPEENRFRSENRKSKFTKEVAAQVKPGDMYFSKRAPSAQRYYVPVQAGEHGFEHDGLACITHVRGEYGWSLYDPGVNLVIRINQNDHSIPYAAQRAIESALASTPLGRAIGRDGMKPVAEALTQKFGASWDDEYENGEHRFTVNTEEALAVRQALIDLLTWAPERGYPEQLGEIGAECDGVGFAKDPAHYTALINGTSDGFNPLPAERGPLPLLSQPVFYAVAGSKDDGRSLNSRIKTLMQAVGVEDEDLHPDY